MPDIFDEVGEVKPDVFDEVESERESLRRQTREARAEAIGNKAISGLANIGERIAYTAALVGAKADPTGVVHNMLVREGYEVPSVIPPGFLEPDVRMVGEFTREGLGNLGIRPGPIAPEIERPLTEFAAENVAGLAEAAPQLVLGKFQPRPVARYFQGQMAAGLQPAIEQAVQAETPEEKLKAGLQLGANVAFPAAIELGLRETPTRIPDIPGSVLRMPEGAKPRVEPPPAIDIGPKPSPPRPLPEIKSIASETGVPEETVAKGENIERRDHPKVAEEHPELIAELTKNELDIDKAAYDKDKDPGTETVKPVTVSETVPQKPKRNQIGKAFDRLLDADRSDLEALLYNWDSVELSEDGLRLFSREMRGSGEKLRYNKGEFFDWLFSDAPFNPKEYDQVPEWTDQIHKARKISVGESIPEPPPEPVPPAAPAEPPPAVSEAKPSAKQPKITVEDLSSQKAAGGYSPFTGKVSLDKESVSKMTPEERASVVRHELAHKIETESELWQKSDDFLWRLWESDRNHPIWDLMGEVTGKWKFGNDLSPEIVAALYADHYPKGTFTVKERPVTYEWEGEDWVGPKEYPIPPELMSVLDQIESELGIWKKKQKRGTGKQPPPPTSARQEVSKASAEGFPKRVDIDRTTGKPTAEKTPVLATQTLNNGAKYNFYILPTKNGNFAVFMEPAGSKRLQAYTDSMPLAEAQQSLAEAVVPREGKGKIEIKDPEIKRLADQLLQPKTETKEPKSVTEIPLPYGLSEVDVMAAGGDIGRAVETAYERAKEAGAREEAHIRETGSYSWNTKNKRWGQVWTDTKRDDVTGNYQVIAGLEGTLSGIPVAEFRNEQSARNFSSDFRSGRIFALKNGNQWVKMVDSAYAAKPFLSPEGFPPLRTAELLKSYGRTEGATEIGNQITIKDLQNLYDEGHTIRSIDTFKKTSSPLTPPAGEPQPPQIGPGPGAMTATEPPKAQIEQLTDAFKGIEAEKVPLKDQVKEAFSVGEKFAGTKDLFSRALAGLKSSGDWIIQKWKAVPNIDDLLRAKGDLSAQLQANSWRTQQWIKQALKAIPRKRDQAAIAKWIDAGGDRAELERGFNETKPEFKQAYLDALNLKGDLLVAARNAQNYFESRLQEAVDAGVLKAGVEDYIHRIYESRPDVAEKAIAHVQDGILKANPALAKKRVFQFDWEAEKLGYKPVQSFITRLAVYESSLAKALAAREFIRKATTMKAADGRPIVDVKGVGIPLEDAATGERTGTLIKPQFNPAKANVEGTANYRGDYVNKEFPALSKWKWVSEDAAGKPILVQGDVAIHPDYVHRINALLEPSRVRYGRYGKVLKPAMAISSTVKQTMLDLSMFHQVQITVHGLEHKVLPWKILQDIDLDNPNVQGLLKGGISLGGEYSPYHAEGLVGASLTRHIPILGPLTESYHNWLFQSYIPRIKMTMALDALERNRARYKGELTEEQILHKTARQANSAFGELNYVMLERSKTAQDIARLIMLAPDFLEARGRFAAEALTKGGKSTMPGFGNEQRAALLLGALTLYVTARIANKMINDQYHFEPENAFSIVKDGHTYSLRTVQGDILHLLAKPLQFWMNRLNPVYGRTLLQIATGRDYFGRKRSVPETLWDSVANTVPIALRSSRERALWESIANSMGVQAKRWSDVDDAFTLANKWKDAHGIGEKGEFIYDPDKDPLRPLKIALSHGDDAGAAKEISKLTSGGTKIKKLNDYFDRYASMPFTGSAANDRKWQKELSEDEKKTVLAAREHKKSIKQLYLKARGQYFAAKNNPK